MSQEPRQPLLTPLPFVGREAELQQLRAAVGSRGCLYLQADGGVGKSRLLHKFHDEIRARNDILETGLIDLQQGRYLQPILLMQGIVRRLRRSLERLGVADDRSFGAYDQEVDAYIERAAERPFYTDVERDKVAESFVAGLAALAARYPIVICLDTFEKLHPAIPEVREYNFRTDRRLEDWLARLLAQLPERTLVVLAGRPRPGQERLLREHLGPLLTPVTVAPFTDTETEQCVGLFDPTLLELAPTIFHCSAGRPVVVALALMMARLEAARGQSWAPPAGLEQAYPLNQEVLSEAFVGSVVKDLAEHNPAQLDLLTKALFLRQGLNIDLLHQLDPGSDHESLLEEVAAFCELPFVKLIDVRGGLWLFTLHDEMYDLLFDKLNRGQRNRWYRTVIDHLSQQMHEPTALRGIDRLQTIHALESDLLFYKMALDPASGYQDYRAVLDSAIRARDEGRDEQLQSDLARFYDPATRWGEEYRRRLARGGLSWNEIVCEEAIRWAQRRILAQLPGRNRYRDAIDYTNKIETQFADVLNQNQLLRLKLGIVGWEARTYLSTTREESIAVNSGLSRLIADLEQLLQEPPNGGRERNAPWRGYVQLLLADTYSRRGYHHRLQQRHRSAIEDYRTAADMFKALGDEADGLRTRTLINMSFALSEQGLAEEALLYAENALRMARREGSRHQTATALNTLARVLRLQSPYRALGYAEQARTLFQQQDSLRGLAICATAEGLVRTQVAILVGFETPAGQQHYTIGCQRFVEAYLSFDRNLPTEVSRRLEARIGLGRLHREYGLSLLQRNESHHTAFEQARTVLHEAEQLATSATPGPVMMSLYENMVVLDVAEGRYAEGLRLLDRARSYVPSIYALKQGVGLSETANTREVQGYWLRLAQVELQTALCQLGLGQDLEGCYALQRAFAFLHTFPTDLGLRATFRHEGRSALVRAVHDHLASLNTLREETNFYAVTHRVEREARAEMERIFRAAEDELGFLA